MAVRHIFTRTFGPQGGFETHQMVSPPTLTRWCGGGVCGEADPKSGICFQKGRESRKKLICPFSKNGWKFPKFPKVESFVLVA